MQKYETVVKICTGMYVKIITMFDNTQKFSTHVFECDHNGNVLDYSTVLEWVEWDKLDVDNHIKICNIWKNGSKETLEQEMQEHPKKYL